MLKHTVVQHYLSPSSYPAPTSPVWPPHQVKSSSASRDLTVWLSVQALLSPMLSGAQSIFFQCTETKELSQDGEGRPVSQPPHEGPAVTNPMLVRPAPSDNQSIVLTAQTRHSEKGKPPNA